MRREHWQRLRRETTSNTCLCFFLRCKVKVGVWKDVHAERKSKVEKKLGQLARTFSTSNGEQRGYLEMMRGQPSQYWDRSTNETLERYGGCICSRGKENEDTAMTPTRGDSRPRCPRPPLWALRLQFLSQSQLWPWHCPPAFAGAGITAVHVPWACVLQARPCSKTTLTHPFKCRKHPEHALTSSHPRVQSQTMGCPTGTKNGSGQRQAAAGAERGLMGTSGD